MTDTGVRTDLDEYAEVLENLNKEIEAYGTQRQSLRDLTMTLQQLNGSNQKVFSGLEATVNTSATVLQELRDLRLPDLQGDISRRYEKHQQALEAVTGTLQHIIQEQQRSTLETLQNAQHSKQALERYVHNVKEMNASQEVTSDRHTEMLDTLASELASIKQTFMALEKQVQTVHTLIIIALIMILAVGVVAAVV